MYVAIAMAAISLYQGMQAASAAEEYNKKMRDNNVIAMTYKVRGINQQQASMEDAYAEKKLNARIQAAQQRGSTVAAGADSGGGGNSLEALANGVTQTLHRNLATIQSNLNASRAQFQSQRDAAEWSTNSTVEQQTQDDSVDYLTPIMKGVASYAMSDSGGAGANTQGTETPSVSQVSAKGGGTPMTINMNPSTRLSNVRYA